MAKIKKDVLNRNYATFKGNHFEITVSLIGEPEAYLFFKNGDGRQLFQLHMNKAQFRELFEVCDEAEQFGNGVF